MGILVTTEEVKQMHELYSSGLSSNAVGAILGRNGRTVRAHLARAGVLRGRMTASRLGASRNSIAIAFSLFWMKEAPTSIRTSAE